MAQVVARLDDGLAAAVDELVAAGAFASRSEAIRLGLEHLVELHRRRRIGEEIVDGYTKVPQTEGGIGWSDDATVQMIADEPW